MGNFRVIESSVIGKKHDQNLCEDAVVVTSDFAAVIDGVTDKTGYDYAGVTGGRFAALILADAIRGLPRDVDGRTAINLLTDALRTAVASFSGAPANGPAAVVVIYSAHRREVWQVGDATFSELGLQPLRQPVPLLIDEVHCRIRSTVLHQLLAEGVPADVLARTDPGRAEILPTLTSQHLHRNKPGMFGFGAIDGTPVPDEFVETYWLDDDVTELVLFSDGYPAAYRTLAEAETQLTVLLAADPLCINELQGTKALNPELLSFDDRSYLRFSI